MTRTSDGSGDSSQLDRAQRLLLDVMTTQIQRIL